MQGMWNENGCGCGNNSRPIRFLWLSHGSPFPCSQWQTRRLWKLRYEVETNAVGKKLNWTYCQAPRRCLAIYIYIIMIKATFKVDGMSIRGGILWMGWPTNIVRALDESPGIDTINFNADTRYFWVSYNPRQTSIANIKSIVEMAGDFRLVNWKEIKGN